MCVPGVDPLTIAGLALSAGSGLMQAQQQNSQARSVVRAREDATRQEVARQQGYRDQAVSAYQAAQPQVLPTNEPQRRQEAADARYQEIQANRPTQGAAPTALPGSAPPEVQDEASRRLRMATQQADAEARRRSTLSAYDTTMFDRNIAATRAGGQVDMYNNFSRGSGAIFPGELQAAEYNAMRRGQSAFPTLLGLAGQGLTLYGSSRPLSGSYLGGQPGGYVSRLGSPINLMRGYV